MLVPLYLDITHASNRRKCELHHINTWCFGRLHEPHFGANGSAPGVQESCVKSMRSSASPTLTRARSGARRTIRSCNRDSGTRSLTTATASRHRARPSVRGAAHATATGTTVVSPGRSAPRFAHA